MPAVTYPNLGLKAGFDPHENGWDDEVTENFTKLSVLTQGGVVDKVSATPGTPTDGQVYIFDEDHPTQANKVAAYIVDTWHYWTPNEGWLLYNRAEDYYEKFDGTIWSEFETAGGIEEAPEDGEPYVRKDGAWAAQADETGIADAPADGTGYVRKDNTWVAESGGDVEEAPEDGALYGRKDGAWEEIISSGGGSSVSITQVAFTGTGASQDVDLGMNADLTKMLVFVNGLFKYPTDDFTVDGDTMTITTNASGDKGMAIIFDIQESGAAASSTRWRMFITSINGGALCSVAELYLYSDEFATDIATTGTITANDTYNGFVAGNALDRSTGSFWAAFPSGLPLWLEVEFDTPQTVKGLGVYPRASELDNSPKDFLLQYYDGATWQTFITVTDQTGWSSAKRDFYA